MQIPVEYWCSEYLLYWQYLSQLIAI